MHNDHLQYNAAMLKVHLLFDRVRIEFDCILSVIQYFPNIKQYEK